jgi:hypothetical protein
VAKEPRDYVNPKLLLRGVMDSLPPVEYVRSTVAALWAHSNNFLEKDDVTDGIVSFHGTISYGQIAEFCGVDYETAKWRMKQMRDKYELVVWERFKMGIRFTFGVRLSGNGLTEVMDYLSDFSQVTAQPESGNKPVQSGNRMAQSGNGLPPLAYQAYLAKTSGDALTELEQTGNDEQHQPRSSPKVSVQPAAQPGVIPPASEPDIEIEGLEEVIEVGPEVALLLHDWDNPDNPLGCDSCLVCGVKAATVRKTGVACKSKAFDLDD